jgi:hypothetical protein
MLRRHLPLWVIACCLVWASCLPAMAAAEPVVLSIQGTLRTPAGTPVADGDYGVAVAFYPAANAAEAVYLEKIIGIPVKGGLFSIELGGSDPTKKLDDALFFGTKAQWLGIQVGSDPEMPRVPLRAVAYAVHARGATKAFGLECSGCVTASHLAAGSVTSSALAEGAVQAVHTNFAWAAAEQKSGTALAALAANTAKLADAAKFADEAGFADNAKGAQLAQQAALADTATLAKGLACTGCVAAAMLAPAVTADLVAGGKLAAVAVSGDYADLKGLPDLTGLPKLAADNSWQGANGFAKEVSLQGANFQKTEAKLLRFENGTKPPAACDPSATGLVYFNTAEQTLYVCNSKAYFPFATAIFGGADNPAQSCKALLALQPATQSGVYWIDPDGKTGPLPASQTWCDMTSNQGGWTLAARMVGGSWCHINANAVGSLTAPGQGSCAKLSDAQIRALYSDQLWLSCGTNTPNRFGKIDDIKNFNTDTSVGNKKMTWSITYNGPTYSGTDDTCCNLGDYNYTSSYVIYSIAKGYNGGNYTADWSGCYNSSSGGWHQGGFLYVR